MAQHLAKFRLLLILVCSLFLSPSYSQSCDKDSFIDFIFSALLTSDDNSTTSRENVQSNTQVMPKPRTENSEFKFGLSLMALEKRNGYTPVGIDMGMYTRPFNSSRWYVGGSVSLYALGNHQFDSLFGEYDMIRTNRDILGISMGMKYKIIRNRKFQMALGIHAGTMVFKAKTFAQDNTCDCEGKTTPNKTLNSFHSVRPNYGVFLNIEIPLKNPHDRIFVDIIRQSPGETTFIKKDGVEINPNRVDYSLNKENWNMMTFQVGYSHYF